MTAIIEGDDFLATLLDLDHYPITQPDSDAYRDVISEAARQLKATGCAQLRGFLKPAAIEELCREVDAKRDLSDPTSAYQNPYLCEDDPTLESDHPIRHFQNRRNRLLCRDRIDPVSPMIRLFQNDAFTQFIRDVSVLEDLYPYADPISGMLVNIQESGDTFPWHFDTNDISISIALRNASKGGIFEYAPHMRSNDKPNYKGVKSVLNGDRENVIQVSTQPGDLQIFWGRFSLHRVTQVESADTRYSLLYGYAREPGVCGSKEVALATFGRFYPEHEKAALNI